LKDLFPEKLLVARDGRYYFIPIDRSLKQHEFDTSDFAKNDSGRMEYKGALASVPGTLGIDVAKFQEDIDWTRVKNAGVTYAFIRVGNRGTGTGKMVDDEKFVQNVEGALAAGIDVGVYYYSQAITRQEAVEEAQYTLNAIQGYDIQLPVVIDIERPEADDYRTQGVSQQEMTDIALEFCNKVSEAGYTPMIYGNLETFTLILDISRLENVEKWIAGYNSALYFPYDFTYWQYSSSGHIDGIKGKVDLNICVKPKAEG
jgi:GH25 family lysozyme M1 (1,4-beta-N-acetylmuramidase)